jgi:hypothetical protein
MNLIVKLNMVPIFFLPLIEGWTGTQEESKVASMRESIHHISLLSDGSVTEPVRGCCGGFCSVARRVL